MTSKSETMTLRFPDDVKEAVSKQATKNVRTIAGQIVYYVKQGLAQDGVKINEQDSVGPRSSK
jgi:hypothetical protein